MVTASTVGYGDIAPKTLEGRLVAVTLMVAGIGLVSTLAATIAAYFVEQDEQRTIDDLLERLDRIETQLSPLKLSSQLGSARTRLTQLDEKQRAAVERALKASSERLSLGMRSLNAMSPLAVLERGYSITQKRSGEIVRSRSP